MTWEDRLIEAAYTSPSGQRIPFIYEDVSYALDRLGATYNFPDSDGTYVQDLGRSGRRFPLSVIFSGANCDLQAAIFTAMLNEPGIGRLEHPAYGIAQVVPLGEITRRDALKSAANQVIIDVTFWETSGLVYPSAQGDAASLVRQAIEDYNQAVAEQYAATIDTRSPSAFASLYSDYSAVLAAARRVLTVATETSAMVQRAFNAVNQSIVNGLDVLIGDPVTLALQTSLLVQNPSLATRTPITTRLDVYKQLIDELTTSTESPGFGPRNTNRFAVKDLFVMGAGTGQVNSTLETKFTTKTEAISAAEFLLDSLDQTTLWRDDNFRSLGQPDPGGAYAALQNAVAMAAGYLVEISFTLLQERVIFLTRARTVVDLVAELYGAVDERLDFFISSNDLTGTEILELPAGRKIVYYI